MKKAIAVILAVIAAYAAVFTTDRILISNEKPPIFCLKKENESGSTYYGLGYSYEVCPHIITGKREYALYIFGQLVTSNFTNSVQIAETPQNTELAQISEPFGITENSPDSFSFAAEFKTYDNNTASTIDFNDEITSPEITEAVWEMLKSIESTQPRDLDYNDSVGESSDLTITLTNLSTSEKFFITDGILYENPNEDGGASVVVISNAERTVYYSSFWSDDGETCYSASSIMPLIMESISTEETSPLQTTQTTQSVSHERSNIVVVSSYKNRADGYTHRGTFIDIDGKVYEFDFTADELKSDEDFVSRLEEYYHSSDLSYSQTISDPDMLWHIISLADSVAYNAEIIKEHTAYDAGQNTVYVLDSDNKLVKLYSYGDYDETNTDPYAMEAADLCRIL